MRGVIRQLYIGVVLYVTTGAGAGARVCRHFGWRGYDKAYIRKEIL